MPPACSPPAPPAPCAPGGDALWQGWLICPTGMCCGRKVSPCYPPAPLPPSHLAPQRCALAWDRGTWSLLYAPPTSLVPHGVCARCLRCRGWRSRTPQTLHAAVLGGSWSTYVPCVASVPRQCHGHRVLFPRGWSCQHAPWAAHGLLGTGIAGVTPLSKGLAPRHGQCLGYRESWSPIGVREGSAGATFPHPLGDRLGQGGARLKTPLETHLSAGVIWGTPSPSRDRCPCLASGLWAASGPCPLDKAAPLMGNRANSLVQAGDSGCPLSRAGGRDCPPNPGGIHLLLGHAGNLTCMPYTCLQPACPPHAFRAGRSACHCITQGCSLPD